MKIFETHLRDIYIFESSKYKDARGVFNVPFNLKEFHTITNFYSDFLQDNMSQSKKGVLRGLHYQVKKPQGKFVRVTRGAVQDVVVDIRQKSPHFGETFSIILTGKDNLSMWIPPGFAHGFLSLKKGTEFCYKVTGEYAPENERTLLWNDSELNIDWNIEGEPLLSSKDIKGKTFNDCEKL